MTRWSALTIVGGLTAGLGLGLAEAARLLRMLSTPSSPWTSTLAVLRSLLPLDVALMLIGLVLGAYGLSLRYDPGRPLTALGRGGAAIAAGVGIALGLTAIARPFLAAPLAYLPAFAAALGIATTAVLYLHTPPPFRETRKILLTSATVAVCWGAFVVVLELAVGDSEHLAFGGFGVFSALAQPPVARVFPSIIQDTLGGALCGFFAGVALLVITRQAMSGKFCIVASSLGFWLAFSLYLAHMVTATVIMQSAFNERVACVSALGSMLVCGLVSGLGLSVLVGGFPRALPRTVALLLMAATVTGGTAHVLSARAGGRLYEDALTAGLYRVRVYLHFRGDGSWTRSVEPNADDLRIAACDRLMQSYPDSIYGPDALYLKARSLFASWQFEEAASTLRYLRERYPDSRGASTTLLAHCYLALGRYQAVTGNFGRDEWTYADWRRTDGAQVIGHAYEVTGRSNSARGLYTYYLQTLSDGNGGSWVKPATAFAEERTERLLTTSAHGVGFGDIAGTVVGPNGAVPGIYIAVVQPHIDGSSPDDSSGFTGALTIPLWFGRAATTDANGHFTIRHVPYGSYEVVVGFDPARLPKGCVISRAVPPIDLHRASLTVPNISLVPAVKPVRPLDGETTGPVPTLTWKPVVGAAYYSASIMAEPSQPGRSDMGNVERYTCWARPRIESASVTVTEDGFLLGAKATPEAAARKLAQGRSYMWIVLAYDHSGRIISSSEHYRLDREPTFLVGYHTSKGGRSTSTIDTPAAITVQ